MNNKTQPILSCAGRESASIDAELLNELLLSYRPNLIGIKQKAEELAQTFFALSNGEYGDESLNEFKSIIYREFLQLQLLEAANLARTASAEAEALPDDH